MSHNNSEMLLRLWALVWRRWMTGCDGEQLRIVRVKGWRTALVEGNKTTRQTITPCFTILGIKFD